MSVPMYIEVHPCANSFASLQSSRYKMHLNQDGSDFLYYTLEDCTKIDSSAAWTSQLVEPHVCVPLFIDKNGEKTHNYYPGLGATLGRCFIFHKPAGKVGPARDSDSDPLYAHISSTL
jgi:hypothetical protein